MIFRKIENMKNNLIIEAIGASFKKLNPMTLWKNPIMFIVELGSVLTTYFLIKNFSGMSYTEFLFILQITIWLWFTVLFANFAEAIAEGRGKAQAMALKKNQEGNNSQKNSGRKRSRKWFS